MIEAKRILENMADVNRTKPKLAVVVPCYNEFEVLDETVSALRKVLETLLKSERIDSESYICLVDDGSADDTWSKICLNTEMYSDVRGLRLARNFGHQGAVLAGMMECDADAVVTIDADLQDDESKIVDMVENFRNGYEVVFGVRSDRQRDTIFKRGTAEWYYRILNALGVKVVFNHADYRLMSRKALLFLDQYSETNLFLRGVVPLVGLKSTTVQYARRERFAGESKYPLKKMLGFAWDGITSFSVVPLRVVSVLGICISFFAFMVSVWAFYQKIFAQTALPGWASTVIPMYFLGGVQILCIGVIGEYVGKIFMEAKRRPRYLIGEQRGEL